MQVSFLRDKGVYLVVSNHVKHFKSVYGKTVSVFHVYIYWDVLLCHSPTHDFIGTLIEENCWHVGILQLVYVSVI
jgi:hypothetical protein